MPLIPSLSLTTTTTTTATSNTTTSAGSTASDEVAFLVAQLRQLDLFEGASTSELQDLTRVLTSVTAQPGEILERQDRPVRHWQVLLAGHALVQRDGSALGLLGPGESWSEHSLFSGQRSPISVVAFSPLTLLTVSRRAFLALPSTHPTLGERLRTRSATSADRLALPVYRALRAMEEGRW
ncbi:MAG TPA: cyclic nucleotide-binding domain-containing protein [Acidimicrobiales bacterium]|jgi:CRP-like cAMP-binding protein|nr:cyclic nucleotide-binding domain-containing protein [Acidimicrobiales bacterium]